MPSTEIQMLLSEIGSELRLANITLDRIASNPPAVIPGQLAQNQSGAAMASGGLAESNKALAQFQQGLDLVPGQFRAIATAARTTATVIKTALMSTGVGAFIVALGVAIGAATALIAGITKLGADFKRVDADIQSTGLSLLEIERSARYASFAFADLDDARAVTMRLADAAQEAQYQLTNFGQVDTNQIIAATRLGVGFFDAIQTGQRGIDAVAEQLRGLDGDLDVRLIRDAFKVSLDDAEYLKILATGTDAQIAEAEKQREEARVIGEREREAAKTQHTTIQDMGADIRNRLIPAVEKLVELSGITVGILETAARELFGYGLSDREQAQRIGVTDIARAGIGDFRGITDAITARLIPDVPDNQLPWWARPANEVAGEIGQQIGAVVADTLGPLASFAERLNPVSISNTYNIQGGARELEDTRRVSDQANMRVVRELQP